VGSAVQGKSELGAEPQQQRRWIQSQQRLLLANSFDRGHCQRSPSSPLAHLAGPVGAGDARKTNGHRVWAPGLELAQPTRPRALRVAGATPVTPVTLDQIGEARLAAAIRPCGHWRLWGHQQTKKSSPSAVGDR